MAETRENLENNFPENKLKKGEYLNFFESEIKHLLLSGRRECKLHSDSHFAPSNL
jgi:hypothetical protein